MPSKRSFFNRTLFRKNLTRFWPLWGGLSAAGSLLPLYMLLALLSGAGRGMKPSDFAFALYQVVSSLGPAASLLYAIICAMLIWSYLYSPRSVGLMHTLPVDRTCLFVTGTLSGFAMMLIPYAVVGGLTCLIALAWGFMDLLAVANTVLAVLLMTVTFFGLATFCAMLTGHVFALPVLYLLANFLAPLLQALTASLSSEFLIGVGDIEAGWATALSPVLKLYQQLSVESVSGYDGASDAFLLNGFGTLALYGLAGAALLALSWLLYRLRASESAGDVAAFPWLRPVFRYGLALLGALTLGRILYELLWASFFQHSQYANPAAMAVCMALAGMVGYYVASMLLEKSLRVFRGSWRGAAAVCAGAAAICLLLSVDAFGAERRIPGREDVGLVSMNIWDMTLAYDAGENPEMVDRILDLHRAIVADRDYIRSHSGTDQNRTPEKSAFWTLHLAYALKDGSRLERKYSLWITADRAADPDAYDGKLAALLSDPQVIVDRFAPPGGARLTNMEIWDYSGGYGGTDTPLTPEEQTRIYDALVRDAQAGRMAMDLLDGSTSTVSYDMSLTIFMEYRTLEAWGGYSYQSRRVNLTSAMEDTIQALLDLGYITQARLELWEEP